MKSYLSFRLFFSAILALVLAACQARTDNVSSDIFIPTDKYIIAATEIVLSLSNDLIIQVGEKETISAVILPAETPFREADWQSDDADVLTLSSDFGKSVVITPLSNGTAMVTASVGNMSKALKVIVKAERVRGISFGSDHLTLLTNTAVDLTALITPVTATNQRVFWSNANTNAAEMVVSNAGGKIFVSNHTVMIKGLSPGNAVITAITEDGSWQATAHITVRDLRVTNILLSTNNLSVKYQYRWDIGTLTAAILPADALNKNIRWESSDTNIAAVTNGVIYPVRSGTVSITAVSEENTNVSAAAEVHILADKLGKITFSPSILTLQERSNGVITASFHPVSSLNTNITWLIGSSRIAMITPRGNEVTVIGMKEGNTVVIAQLKDSYFMIPVMVRADFVTGVSLSTNRMTLITNTAAVITAAITPSTATNQKIIWSNNNPTAAVMVVSNNTVRVTGVSPGNAVITATTADGGWQGTAHITVRDLRVTNVFLDTANLTVEYRNEGDTGTLTATALPADALNKNIRWESSDTGIAAVTNGVIYPVRSGTVTITAASVENPTLQATAAVTVRADWMLRLSLSPVSIGLEQTSNARVTASFYPVSALNTNLTWTSGNPAIATVSGNGDKTADITGVKLGNTVITASAGGVFNSVPVTVRADFVTGVSLSTNRMTLITNTAAVITAAITPSTATNQTIIWSSDNPAATVTASSSNNAVGVVTGVSPGNAVITATTADGGWQGTAHITVRDLRVTNVFLDTANLTVEYRKEGDTGTLTATALPADALNKNIRWLSSNTSIATVTNGVIYPVRSGTVTITAISEDDNSVQATAAVTVKADWLLRLSLSPVSIGLEQTSNAVVTASFYPVSALNTNLTWSSGNPAIATVSGNGDKTVVITGISGGRAVITASAGGKSATVTVNVIPDLPRNLRQNLTCSKTDTAELVWDASTGADSYEVYRLENGTANRITATTSTGYTAAGLSANTYYTYEVKACFGGQCSAPSSLRIVTGSSGNDLAAVMASGKIPDKLNNYDDPAQAIFGGYTSDADIIFRYILPRGAGSMDGSSWANAAANLKTVLDGINDAAAGKVYAVLIKPGTYRAGVQMEMKNYVTIAGGVSGCGTIPSNAGEESTMLSGANSYRVFNNSSLNNHARLYRVTIADGNTTGDGGGMYNSSSSPVLTEVVFSGNTALFGGGMYNDRSSPVLTGVIFSGNTATSGGGGMDNNNSSPVLTEVVFSGNRADYNGGGIQNWSSSPILIKVVFSGNTAGNAGSGIFNNYSSSSPTVVNTIFWGESVYNWGGGSVNFYYSVVSGGNAGSPYNNIITNPGLLPLTDNGGGIDTMAIPTTSPAVNKGLYVKRSGSTHYYSINKTDWYTSPALSGTAVTLPNDAIDLTATDMTGYPVNGRPDIGVYEAR